MYDVIRFMVLVFGGLVFYVRFFSCFLVVLSVVVIFVVIVMLWIFLFLFDVKLKYKLSMRYNVDDGYMM